SSSVKETVNVYRPFTCILLLEIVSLFTAYLFATQNIVRKVKYKFKLDKLHDTDITTVGDGAIAGQEAYKYITEHE
ncbi:hypothetical protein, partial [Streptococcus gordonii]|uniref:hypothetical protein n=1 Tax=Streptococcus gordonii TaxID=1302 RepID=UPI0023B200E8